MVIPVKETDLLEQDPPIRGQSYACISFISPEEIIHKKESFYIENYIQHFSKDINELFDGLTTTYPNDSDKFRSIREQYDFLFNKSKVNDDYHQFVNNNNSVLDKEFNEKYDFQTNVRGIKIRGVYDSVKEAQLRCEHLRKLDNNKFNIYISEVGTWCPWAPNPSDIADQEYAVDSLNTLMHEYEKNLQSKDEHFAERKSDLKERIAKNEVEKKEAQEQNQDQDQHQEQDKADILVESFSNTNIEEIKKTLEDDNIHIGTKVEVDL